MTPYAVAIETSTRTPSIAIRWGERIASADLEASHSHASDLLPALERLMASMGARPREVSVVIAGTGPGSYTGLRVGAATALGLARGSGARALGVPSTDALAFGHLRAGRRAAIVIDARSSQLYFARYARSEVGLDVLDAPCVLDAAELRARLQPGELVFADDDAVRAGGLADLGLTLERAARPRAEHALELGLTRAALGLSQPIEPLYLRAFAAKSRRR